MTTVRLGLGPVLSVSEVLDSSFSPLLPFLLEEDMELFERDDVEESLRPPLPSFSESDLLPPPVYPFFVSGFWAQKWLPVRSRLLGMVTRILFVILESQYSCSNLRLPIE
jgi:hypothetical protein